MFCHQCGARIDDPDDRFCSRCGAALNRGETAPASPLAEPPADRHRRPISAWPDRPRERIQLPLTELRQRRARDAGEPVPVPPSVPPVAAPPVAPEPAPTEPAATPVAEEPAVEIVEPVPEPEETPSTSRSRAEAALRRMVPPKDEWAVENRPGGAERTRVRDEWPAQPAPPEAPALAPTPEVPAAAPVPPAPPAADDPIIPWLEPPVVPVPPERPVPPSREARPEEGPIIVPRDYDEKAARQRKGRRRGSRSRGPLLDPAALGRSIKPSWILAIAGVILLTLIVFALFPPGGAGDAATPDKVNPFTRMPVHTVATPARPAGGSGVTPADTVATDTAESTATPGPTAARRPPAFGILPGATTATPRAATETTTAIGATDTAPPAGESGIRVVVSSVGGWSGTIGQQAETYTETPVVGSGTQVRVVTGPVTMITANIQKLEQTADPLEVRVEQDGAVLKRGETTEPGGIVALSVQL